MLRWFRTTWASLHAKKSNVDLGGAWTCWRPTSGPSHTGMCSVAAKVVRPWRSFRSSSKNSSSKSAYTQILGPAPARPLPKRQRRLPSGGSSFPGAQIHTREDARDACLVVCGWLGLWRAGMRPRTRLRHTRSRFPARLFDNASSRPVFRVPPPRPSCPGLAAFGPVLFWQRLTPLCWKCLDENLRGFCKRDAFGRVSVDPESRDTSGGAFAQTDQVVKSNMDFIKVFAVHLLSWDSPSLELNERVICR